MRSPCNEIALSDGFRSWIWHRLFQKLFMPTTYLGDMHTFGGQESAQLSRLLAVLPSLCENAVNSGLAWSFSRWSDSSACSAKTQGAMKTGPAPDESPVSVRSDNSYLMGWQPHQIGAMGPSSQPYFHGFGSRGWICADISPEPYKLWTWNLHLWIQQRLRFKRMRRNVVTTPSDLELWAPEVNHISWI